MANRSSELVSLTPRMALNLAAPHTWPAAVLPTLVAVCASSLSSALSVTMVVSLLLIVVLMQSSVNTFNDYYDYVKGSDSAEDNVDESDAVLVYNNVDPRQALFLAIGYLGAAFVLGIYPIVCAGFGPLVIALVGALFVVLYSAGKSPISYLPLGELVSGVVMGGLVPLAVYLVCTGTLSFLVLVWSVPEIIGVGLIMFTNNLSDIERDEPTGRKTLPVLMGRARSVIAYKIAVVSWIVSIVVIVGIWFTPGLIVCPFMVLSVYPLAKAVFANTFTPERRLQSMPQVLSLNIVLGAFYAASILASGVAIVL